MSSRKHSNISRAIRVRETSYRLMRSLKQRTEKKLGKAMTYSEYLDELSKVAELMLDSQQLYKVGNTFYLDNAEAWGAAIVEQAKGVQLVPEVYLYIGLDSSFGPPETEA